MKKYFDFTLREPKKIVSLPQLREQLLKRMLFSSFLIGTVLFAFALVPALPKGLYYIVSIYTVLYVWMILITFLPRVPYWVRSSSWLVFFYILGTVNLSLSGFNVDAGLFFLTFIAMTALMGGLRGGLIALGFSSITIAVTGSAIVSGHYRMSLELPQTNSMLWLIGGTVFLLMGILLTMSLSVVVHGLGTNLTKATSLAGELEQANEALSQSEERYRTLVETSPDLILLLDLNGNILVINQAGLALFRYENMGDAVGKDMLTFIATENQSQMKDAFQRILETGGIKDTQCLAVKKDGTIFPAEFSASLVVDTSGRPQAVIAIGKDITARKQVEQMLQQARDNLAHQVVETTVQLQQTTEWLNELVIHSPTVIYSTHTSEDFAVTYISENVSTLLGYEASQFIGEIDFWRNHIHPEDRERIFAEAKHISEQERITFEYRFLNKEGEYRWLHDERMLARNVDGKSTGYVGSFLDITESKIIERALRESEERYRTLAEAVPDLIFIVDPDDCVLYVNSFSAAFIGLPPEKIVGQSREHFFPSSTNDHQKKNIQNVLASGKMSYVENESTIRDRTVWLGTWLVPLRGHSGNISGVLGVSRDITRQRQADAAILQSRDLLEERVKERTADLLASQTQLRQLTNQIVTAQEEERHRLSRELHDDAGQVLISLKYSLASTLNELPDDQQLIRQRLADSMEIVDQTMNRIREMARSLRPPVLDVGGINLSLQDYCQDFMARTQLQVDYRGHDIPGLPDEISISLYRFVQEALTNILKHAQATQAKVRLKYHSKQISLLISDNGHGIGDLSQSDGIGLLGIRERLDLLGGSLQVHSQKGQGVKLTACVPWSGMEKESKK
ncbi:MAG: PAS domain S-box protein [Chloroflexota bacterium]